MNQAHPNRKTSIRRPGRNKTEWAGVRDKQGMGGGGGGGGDVFGKIVRFVFALTDRAQTNLVLTSLTSQRGLVSGKTTPK